MSRKAMRCTFFIGDIKNYCHFNSTRNSFRWVNKNTTFSAICAQYAPFLVLVDTIYVAITLSAERLDVQRLPFGGLSQLLICCVKCAKKSGEPVRNGWVRNETARAGSWCCRFFLWCCYCCCSHCYWCLSLNKVIYKNLHVNDSDDT